MFTQKDVTKILESAKSILESESVWIQGKGAVNPIMEEVESTDESACKWCLSGAIRKAMHHSKCDVIRIRVVEFPVVHILEGQGYTHLIHFNDDPNTTHKDVMAILNKSIDLSRQLEDRSFREVIEEYSAP